MDAIEAKTRKSLAAILAAPGAVLYLSTKATAAHVAGGMLIQNANMKDDKGNLATKLTPYGLNYLNSPEGTDPATVEGDKTIPAPDAPADGADSKPLTLTVSEIKGRDGTSFARVAMSLPSTNNARQSGYPTDALVAPVDGPDGKVYDGIFLGPTDKVKEPAKAYPAVASAANKRWKDEKPARKFTSRVMDGEAFGKPGVMGVGIFRIE